MYGKAHLVCVVFAGRLFCTTVLSMTVREEEDVFGKTPHGRILLDKVMVFQFGIQSMPLMEFEVRVQYISRLYNMTNRTRLEIVGLMRRWTSIWDMGKPDLAKRSINDISNLKSSLPRRLSIERARVTDEMCWQRNTSTTHYSCSEWDVIEGDLRSE
jgi:hypothetical protein